MAQELSKINENKIVELVLTDCKVGCEGLKRIFHTQLEIQHILIFPRILAGTEKESGRSWFLTKGKILLSVSTGIWSLLECVEDYHSAKEQPANPKSKQQFMANFPPAP